MSEVKTKEQATRVVSEAIELLAKIRRCGLCLTDQDETLLNDVERSLRTETRYVPSSKVLERLRWLVAERCW